MLFFYIKIQFKWSKTDLFDVFLEYPVDIGHISQEVSLAQ